MKTRLSRNYCIVEKILLVRHQLRPHVIPSRYFQKIVATVEKEKSFYHQTLNSIHNVKLAKQNIYKKWKKEKQYLHQTVQTKDKKLSKTCTFLFLRYFLFFASEEKFLLDFFGNFLLFSQEL